MRIDRLLRESAARHGGAVAVVAGKGRYTYSELDAKSDRLASALQSRGLKHGDRVVAFMGGGWPAVVSLFAVLKAGGVFHIVDPLTSIEDLACLLQRCGAVGIVTGSRSASAAGAAIAAARSVRLVLLAGGDSMPATSTCLSFEEVVGRTGPAPQPPPAADDSDAAIAFGAEPPLTHWEILDAVEQNGGLAGALATLAPWDGRPGLLRIFAAFRDGATVVLGKRTERSVPRAASVADLLGDGYVGLLSESLDSAAAARV